MVITNDKLLLLLLFFRLSIDGYVIMFNSTRIYYTLLTINVIHHDYYGWIIILFISSLILGRYKNKQTQILSVKITNHQCQNLKIFFHSSFIHLSFNSYSFGLYFSSSEFKSFFYTYSALRYFFPDFFPSSFDILLLNFNSKFFMRISKKNI